MWDVLESIDSFDSQGKPYQSFWQFEASNLDNILDLINGGFLLIGHLDQIDDFSGELLLLGRMKQIGTDIIARMLHDKMQCEPLAKKAIPGFDLNTVAFEVVGPVFDNDFGILYTVRFQESLVLGSDLL